MAALEFSAENLLDSGSQQTDTSVKNINLAIP